LAIGYSRCDKSAVEEVNEFMITRIGSFTALSGTHMDSLLKQLVNSSD